MIPNEEDESNDEESSSDQVGTAVYILCGDVTVAPFKSGRSQLDVILTDINGKSRSITFPGCYRVKLSFRMNRPIENPYIEGFLQLGQNIPCRAEGRTTVSNICTNITKTSWCPQSVNNQLRGMLTNKETWLVKMLVY
ncbi:hypothetical protein Y032_0007g3348 [Ancylostoma ceylanicum]|uniref:Uncharacterized protein n=1 Tax=Ancylostoma ceylanicum TaxID=53326 RepID=A0A016VM44_9BILA|nr:hypothetical protein Y032_0007g3348 [Ancylostoma ceylanicum]